MRKRILPLLFLAWFTITIDAASIRDNPLAPVKRDHPRDTLKSFMDAMEAYREGVEKQDEELMAFLDKAVDCLDLSEVADITRVQEGREAAKLLKEVIDRLVKVDYARVPDDPNYGVWRFPKSEIKIYPKPDGEEKGEYFFTPRTVAKANQYYELIKTRPYIKGTGGGAHYKVSFVEEYIPAWAMETFASVAYWQWIGLFASILLGLVMKSVARLIGSLVMRMTSKTASKWDDVIVESLVSPVALFIASCVWFGSIYILRFEDLFQVVLITLVKATFFIAVTWMAYRCADVLAKFLEHKAQQTKTKLDDQIVKLITRSLKIAVVIFGALLGIQNMGVEVFSLLAGLGIGGLAVALAAKDTLANFFGSIMIMIDRPFQIGDWVIVKGQEGTVEDVGFRSTKIRTFYNSLIAVPNSEVAISPIDNMGRRQYRRVKTYVGITYDTPPVKIEAFLEGIKNIIKANQFTRKDYFHVVFNEFGSSSLDIMLYFFLKVPNWNEELVQRQNIFLEIVNLAHDLGIDFAFPTQSLHIETFPEKQPVRQPHRTDQDEMAAGALAYGPKGSKAQPYGSGMHTPPHKDPDLSADTRSGGDGE
ncbi:MAG: mechanosensitive ion channel family protein [Verrucomicrobiota bacterium]